MNERTDIEVSRRVRSLLAVHWIDLGRITIRTVFGCVYVKGLLVCIDGAAHKLTPDVVGALATGIERLDGVERVVLMFDNWQRAGERWMPAAVRRADAAAPTHGA